MKIRKFYSILILFWILFILHPPIFAIGNAGQSDSLSKIIQGSRIKALLRSGQQVYGRMVKWGPEYLTIKTDSMKTIIMRDSIQVLWKRQPATWNGAKTGFVIGGISGGVFTLVLTEAINALSESGDNDFGLGEKIVSFTAGAIFGGILSGGIGAIVGGSIPYWKKVYEAGPQSAERYNALALLSEEKYKQYGEFQWLLSYSQGLPDRKTRGGIIGFNFRLLNIHLISTHIATGPEFGYFNPGDAEDPSANYHQKRIQLYGWILRWEYRRSIMNPYLTIGSGFYHWRTSYGGFSYGAGFRRHFERFHTAFIFEGRLHRGFGHNAHKAFFTLQTGISWSW